MLGTALVATGHGYEAGSRGRCDAFDAFEILANPLGGFGAADRESRTFKGKSGPGVTYGSHALYLMRRRDDRTDRALYVAVHHGGGRRIWQLPACYYYREETAAALVAMEPRALYSLLYGIVELAEEAAKQARDAAEHKWRKGAVDKRIRVSRQPSKRRAFAWVEPEREPGESEEQHRIRCAFAKPSGVR